MPSARANSYRLTPAARSDLEGIWHFTAAHWSVHQAERYVDGLFEAFSALVAHPAIAPERREISPPVRLYRYLSHLIVYRLEAPDIVVIRIVHFRQNWRALLAD